MVLPDLNFTPPGDVYLPEEEHTCTLCTARRKLQLQFRIALTHVIQQLFGTLSAAKLVYLTEP
jgi:hypothetical protein